MRAPGQGRGAQGLDEKGLQASRSSTVVPLPQALAARGWSVARVSKLTLKLTKDGSVLFASARRRHHADTLDRVAAVDSFAARCRRP
jgi:hypothetical protein